MYWNTRTSPRKIHHRSQQLSKFPTLLFHISPLKPNPFANLDNRLKDLEGDWHEFESKALRKENERKNQEARRAVRLEEKEKEKRRASGSAAPTEREPKRLRPSSSHSAVESK